MDSEDERFTFGVIFGAVLGSFAWLSFALLVLC
jgi:hypothetical protein